MRFKVIFVILFSNMIGRFYTEIGIIKRSSLDDLFIINNIYSSV